MIGTDIVKVSRFKNMPKGFVKKVFTPLEIKYCLSKSDPSQHFAARFAAKEAVIKALKQPKKIGFSNIEIFNNGDNSPSARLVHLGGKNFSKDICVSLSHTEDYAIAVAICL